MDRSSRPAVPIITCRMDGGGQRVLAIARTGYVGFLSFLPARPTEALVDQISPIRRATQAKFRERGRDDRALRDRVPGAPWAFRPPPLRQSAAEFDRPIRPRRASRRDSAGRGGSGDRGGHHLVPGTQLLRRCRYHRIRPGRYGARLERGRPGHRPLRQAHPGGDPWQLPGRRLRDRTCLPVPHCRGNRGVRLSRGEARPHPRRRRNPALYPARGFCRRSGHHTERALHRRRGGAYGWAPSIASPRADWRPMPLPSPRP